MGKNRSSTIEDLIRALSSRDDLARMEARRSLVAMGVAAVPKLLDALKEPHTLVREQVIHALGEIGDPSVAAALAKALEDEAFEVRWAAGAGLIQMDADALKPLLHALMDRADSVLLREGVHRVFHEFAKRELKECVLAKTQRCPTKECLDRVLKALEEKASAVRVHLVAAEAIKLLEEFENKSREDDSLLRQFAAMPREQCMLYHSQILCR